MIHSIFILNNIGDILIEKHYRAPVPRTVLDPFLESQSRTEPEEVPPAIQSSRHYLINIFHKNLYFIAVVDREEPPLFIIEFLRRIVSTFEAYFMTCNQRQLLKEVVTVYRVLEEMLDNGFPLATELNVLKEMIRPPTISAKIEQAVTGKRRVKDTLPSGQLTNTQWRKAGVKYSTNECFVDVVEEIDTIVDRQGSTITAEVQGKIMVKCRLSGMPDCTLSFINPGILDDLSFHPCVRLLKWSSERVLSFVPPDGNFALCSYIIGSHTPIGLPVFVRPTVTFFEGGGKLEVEVGAKQTSGKQPENMMITIPMPKAVNSVNLNPSVGSISFDQISKVVKWEIKKLPLDRLATLKGPLSLAVSEPIPEGAPTINVHFKIQNMAASGLKINRLDVFGEKYKPFKGVKYITMAGKYQVRG